MNTFNDVDELVCRLRREVERFWDKQAGKGKIKITINSDRYEDCESESGFNSNDSIEIANENTQCENKL